MLHPHDSQDELFDKYTELLENVQRNIKLIHSGVKKPQNIRRRLTNLRLEERLLLEKISPRPPSF